MGSLLVLILLRKDTIGVVGQGLLLPLDGWLTKWWQMLLLRLQVLASKLTPCTHLLFFLVILIRLCLRHRWNWLLKWLHHLIVVLAFKLASILRQEAIILKYFVLCLMQQTLVLFICLLWHFYLILRYVVSFKGIDKLLADANNIRREMRPLALGVKQCLLDLLFLALHRD